MKFFNIIIILLVFLCVSGWSSDLFGQDDVVHAKNGMTTGVRNYKSFTSPFVSTSSEVIQQNAGYEHHPELGKLFAETPCDNCYELIGKRTEISKTFVQEGTDGKSIMQQTSNAPMHYKDASGNWITIKTQLRPDKTIQGVYAATEQEVPATINTANKRVTLGKMGQQFEFDQNLELVYQQPDGVQVSLGAANWSNYTAGDDGVYVTNAWPGVDIEVFVIRGSVKTNFWINKAMPAYAAGKLLVRDHLQMAEGLSLTLPEGQALAGYHVQNTHTGNLEIRSTAGEKMYTISGASAFEKEATKTTLRMLEYYVNDNTLDIVLPGDFLDRPASSYPVIIDPLVSASTISAVSGTTYSPTWTVGCVYTNPATVPAKITITDVQFSFQYVTSGGALLNNGAFDFKLGTCRSPTPTALYWNCNSLLAGTCTGTGASIFSSLFPCVPPPACLPFNMNLTMDFYQNYLSDPPCSNLYITAGTPLTITVFGHTIDSGYVTASPATLCQGQSSTLSTTSVNGVPPYSYVWNPGGLTGSPVTVTPSSTTTYTVTSTDACGDVITSTKKITVNPVAPITGTTTVCVGNTTSLSDAIGGGTWTSGNTYNAIVGSSSGVVTGLSAGTAIVSYTNTSGCNSTVTVTVLPLPSAITGPKVVCLGNTISLSDATAGGSWTSSNSSIASIGSSTGLVTGLSAGKVTITYTIPSGCFITTTVTVSPVAPITGITSVCVGGTTLLSDAIAGGTWTSSNTAVATIGSSSGMVSGMSVGTANITYSTGGCTATTTVTVSLLSPITGITTVCQGSTTSLSDAFGGGNWTSGNSSIASVGVSTGVVAGVAGGTANITYLTPGGCFTYTTVTVNPLAAITGATSVCFGNTTTLSDATPGGTWSSTNTTVATIGLTGIVSGLSPGTSTIKYTTPAGCIATVTVTVNLVLPITGTTTICQGSTTTLSDGTSGGTWVSGNVPVAAIGISSGVVTGASGGTSIITYTSSAGCTATITVTVNPLSPITGSLTICAGNNTTLSDATPGGNWSSTNTAVATIDPSTGVVSGIGAGTSSITYTTPAGCIASAVVTVNAIYPITGSTTVCQGSGTILSNLTGGGTWTSSITSSATINISTGVVVGVAPGTSSITYTIPGGCFATATVTVYPFAPITGTPTVCQGQTTNLSDAVAGGTWSSTNTAVATVDASGIVTGLLSGTSTIQYTTSAGCVANITVTVNALSAITGITTICQGSTTALSDAAPGGTWVSSFVSIASIGITSGVVTGISGGTSTITYTLIGGCMATTTVTVNPIGPITGITTVCQGFTTNLNDATPGGTWSSSNTSVATIDMTGVVTGVSNGTSTIQYITTAGCIATTTVNVNPLSPITGLTSICNTTSLSDATPGGSWTSSNTSIATIGLLSGIVNPLTAGTTSITYTTVGGCFTAITVTVNPFAPITGPTSVCAGSNVTLSDAILGGTWTSSNTSVATVDGVLGVVSGISGGTSIVSYTTPAGCVATANMLVNPLVPITGTTTLCQGSSSTLSDAVTGGTWISVSPSVATIGITSGVATGVSAGTSTITYTTPAGCITSTDVTVNPLAPITGTLSVCQGLTTILSDATTGGSWSSSNTMVATIGSISGIATGVSAGTASIQYTTSLGCVGSTILTVNPISAITGVTTVCQGSTTTLSDAATGGTWTSTIVSVASIGLSSGIASGLSSGTTTITYTTPAGCVATTTVTVNPLAPITGTTFMCAGNTTLLSDAVTGGTWSSSTTAIATIDLTSGLVNGLSAGTSSIQYTTTLGCTTNTTVTVDPVPSVITGVKQLCVGKTTTLGNTLAGGTWASANPASAPIGLLTGVVTGLVADTATIIYTTTGGCFVITTVTVNPLPLPITGSTSICQGSTTTLSDATTGGAWSSSSTTVATIGALTGLVSGIAPGLTTITYTTPAGCIATALVTVNPLPYAITGATTVCVGSNTVLSDGLAGGAWSSSNTSVASISASTGLLTGLSAGTAMISYTTPPGCFVIVPALVNPTPVINSTTSTGPTTCVTTDGTITLTGLNPGESYTVNYMFGTTVVTIVITADGSGNVVITGLAKGSYSNFSVTTTLGCTSNVVAGPIVLSLPLPPPAPTAGSNSPICDGTTLQLTATDATPGVTYSWAGVGGFTSGLQNPMISPAALTSAGTYTVTATILGCVSAPATTTVVVHPIPKIASVTAKNPSTCQGTDGTLTLDGLSSGLSYIVNYSHNGTSVTVTSTANGTGQIILTGLSSGIYSNITASSFTCVSNIMGPITLTDPFPAPPPMLGSNSPICAGNTLQLTATEPVKNVAYEWIGPNGFTSNIEDPAIPNIALEDSGVYSLTVRYLNCPSSSSVNVHVNPPVVLTNVTASQEIPYGTSIQLNAEGALFYLWTPEDGTLNNPNIYNPVASPTDPTVYVVHGINTFGCTDSAMISITLGETAHEFVPNAFSPNGDGRDDIFKVGNTMNDKLIEFSVYNRWGNLIYHNNYDITKGWDGTYNGVPQDIGSYNYIIILGLPNGRNKVFKGDVTLIR